MALDSKIKQQLQGYLDKLVHPFVVHYCVDDSDKGQELLSLLEEIKSMTDKIVLLSANLDRKPSFTIADTGITFAGVPLGHEFTSLVLALLMAGGYPMKLSEEEQKRIKELDISGNFETFISLSCHNCPEVVQAFNIIAFLNHNISHTMVDGALFQDEVKARNILSVPMIFRDGELWDQGPSSSLTSMMRSTAWKSRSMIFIRQAILPLCWKKPWASATWPRTGSP